MIAGGLFSISRSWFKQVGMYDPHLNIWGGENFGLSGRVLTFMILINKIKTIK